MQEASVQPGDGSTPADIARTATPVVSADSRNGIEIPACFLAVTDPRKRAYLIAQSLTPIIRDACRAAGIDQKTAWWWKRRAEQDGDEAYLAALECARDLAIGALEDEAYHRALHGIEEPVFGAVSEPVEIETQKGPRTVWRTATREVGRITKKSDTLTIFMLKAARPNTYRERIEHSGTITTQLQVMLPDNGRPLRLPSGDEQ